MGYESYVALTHAIRSVVYFAGSIKRPKTAKELI